GWVGNSYRERHAASRIESIHAATEIVGAADLTPTKDLIDWRFEAGEIRGRKLTRRLTEEQVVQAIKASPLKFSRMLQRGRARAGAEFVWLARWSHGRCWLLQRGRARAGAELNPLPVPKQWTLSL